MNEVEALDSIYCGDIEILTEEPYHKFRIFISTEGYDVEEQSNGIACKLVFTFTAKYPDEAPVVEMDDPINFEESYESKLLEHLHKTIEENLGMEMIFSLVSSAQEWLNVKWDELKQEEENEKTRKLMEAEEAERKKFEGTRVTVETFMKWKMDFEESTGIAAKRDKISDSKKLTGRELFLRDNTLNESDIKYLIEAGENVESIKIDESLFQNIGDLDLDSDDDDESWLPNEEDDDDD